MKVLLALSAVLVLAPTVHSSISRTVSSNAGLRLSPQPSIPWESTNFSSPSTLIKVFPNHKLQLMRGFGASLLESGAINLNSLPASKQHELLDLLFSDSGAALSAVKAPIPCDDFCAAGPWYTYDDSPGDVNMKNFSIERDLRPNGTLTLLKRAKQHGFQGIVQSYMDYPPDWMLLGKLPDNATVDPKYYDALALYYADFVKAYSDHGVRIDYLSLFNEPVDSYTNIGDGELANLLSKHVGPLFDRLGLKQTKLTSAGQCSRETAAQHISGVMEHSEVKPYMQHLAYHGYDCQFNCSKKRQNYDRILDIHKKYPGLELFMTEICYAYNGDDPNCRQASTMWNCTDWPRNHSLAPALPRFAFDDGRVWGSRIVSDVEAGASGWIYWNLLLDMSGGPFQFSPKHNDDGANLQQAVVHIDASSKEYHTTGLFWYLAHFSKFVPPGMQRVSVTVQQSGQAADAPEGSQGIESVGFIDNQKGVVVLQLLNHDSTQRTVGLDCQGRVARIDLPAVSITTARFALAK